MIDLEKVKNKGTLVEEKFCKPFEQLQSHPMTEEITETLVRLYLAPKDQPIPGIEGQFLYQLMEKRINYCFTFKVEDWRLLLFLILIANSPGTCIMYLTYFQYWCKKNDTREVDLVNFCEIFPMGFPSDEDLSKLWNDTKVKRGKEGGSDNLVDHQDALKSIQFEEIEI